MDRKQFIHKSCSTCFLGAAALFLPHLTGCAPVASSIYKTVASNNQVEVPLKLFDKSGLQFVRPQGWSYDIAVQKTGAADYSAILMRCTHMDNQLTYSQNGFGCSLHGSQFGNDGHVIKGPAELPLKKYTTSIKNDQLVITL